jgi:predicted unusual protein kinase regulating ubiquinone biosynthesis (AarF/ABC1/UbiB family)
MLDGIARSLDPNYNLIGAARPFITDMAKSNKKAIAVGLSKQATAYFKQRWQQPQRMVDAIESVQERLELEIAERRDRDLAVDRERRHLYAAFASLTYLLLAILFALGATAATIIKSPTYAIVFGIFSSLGLLCWFASIVTLLLRTKLDRWNG